MFSGIGHLFTSRQVLSRLVHLLVHLYATAEGEVVLSGISGISTEKVLGLNIF